MLLVLLLIQVTRLLTLFASQTWHEFRVKVSRAGIGKSTLLNLISGTLKPSQGHITINPSARLATFSQHHVDGMDMALSPLQALLRAFPNTKEQEMRYLFPLMHQKSWKHQLPKADCYLRSAKMIIADKFGGNVTSNAPNAMLCLPGNECKLITPSVRQVAAKMFLVLAF